MHSPRLYNTVKTRPDRAFTFIEVMAALAIVSISLLALLRLHLTSLTVVERAQLTSQAVLLANEKIEETLAQGYPQPSTKSGTAERGALSLRWRTQVTDLDIREWDEADINGLRKISVDVSWEQGRGRKSVQLSTYVADRKLK